MFQGTRRTMTQLASVHQTSRDKISPGPFVYKTEVIRHSGPWRNMEHVEFETLKWVDWFNNRRLLEPIGDIPPIEFEELHSEKQKGPVMVAGLKQ